MPKKLATRISNVDKYTWQIIKNANVYQFQVMKTSTCMMIITKHNLSADECLLQGSNYDHHAGIYLLEEKRTILCMMSGLRRMVEGLDLVLLGVSTLSLNCIGISVNVCHLLAKKKMIYTMSIGKILKNKLSEKIRRTRDGKNLWCLSQSQL